MSQPSPEFPAVGRLAGIDYGTVRIGVAICDPGRTIASPYENYTRRSERLDGEFFRRLATEERIAGFVVGLPLHMSGDESEKSREARRFGAWLGGVTGKPILFHDERFTSSFAADAMSAAGLSRKQRKERLDKLAAQMILASYLESSAASRKAGSIDDASSDANS